MAVGLTEAPCRAREAAAGPRPKDGWSCFAGPPRLQPSLAGLGDQSFYAALEPPQARWSTPRPQREPEGAEPSVDVIQAEFEEVMVDAI